MVREPRAHLSSYGGHHLHSRGGRPDDAHSLPLEGWRVESRAGSPVAARCAPTARCASWALGGGSYLAPPTPRYLRRWPCRVSRVSRACAGLPLQIPGYGTSPHLQWTSPPGHILYISSFYHSLCPPQFPFLPAHLPLPLLLLPNCRHHPYV